MLNSNETKVKILNEISEHPTYKEHNGYVTDTFLRHWVLQYKPGKYDTDVIFEFLDKQIEKLKRYCSKMLLDFSFEEDALIINDKYYLIVDTVERLFNEELDFLPNNELEEGFAGWVYEFGGRGYLNEREEKLSLTELKNIGKVKQRIPTNSFLGIHSGYELMNGVGLYKDWVKKAKFLGVTTLGICEKNTLSGVLVFQSACQSE